MGTYAFAVPPLGLSPILVEGAIEAALDRGREEPSCRYRETGRTGAYMGLISLESAYD